MPIDELITRLQAIEKTHPNIKVYMSMTDTDSNVSESVQEINIGKLGNSEVLVFLEHFS